MAVGRKGDLGIGASVKTLKGFYVRSWLGRYVISKSPSQPKTPNRSKIWHQNQFAIAARMAASPLWLDQISAMNAAKGTEQVPRDVLMMAAYGNLVGIIFPDGTESTVADHGPPPPSPPKEKAKMINWILIEQIYGGMNSASGNAFRGVYFTPHIDVQISGSDCMTNAIAGGSYRSFIATIDASRSIIEIIADATAAPVLSGVQMLHFDMETQLAAGTAYVLMFGRTDLTGSYNFPCFISGASGWTWPATQGMLAELNTLTPGPGTTLNTAGGSKRFPMALEMTW